MKRLLLALIIATFLTAPATAAEPHLAHMVYFKLIDTSDDAKKQLVAACHKYLSKHEGTVYYSAGVLAEDLKRSVNDLDFDVSLNLVFQNKAVHDKYQSHPRHIKFIEENRDTWAKVRVFDSYLAALNETN